MLHCWALLEHNEKWRRQNEDLHPLKKRPSSGEDAGYGNDGAETGTCATPGLDVPKSKRPPGRKAKEWMRGYRFCIQGGGQRDGDHKGDKD
ncbi:hypothetical protein PR202_ga02472 [Eleusine coracana subsp. coracana]|uniref:No apical meristem-associated C-terminal domain-containing protein n=1 Tax=Eleusine coracana subsp. coracana TaxID=191504 RepID=A0AAV5BLS8_ELECO|nr:hypothetical protein PR202_ga02472 [Eleusine coracana subsp. coracana]